MGRTFAMGAGRRGRQLVLSLAFAGGAAWGGDACRPEAPPSTVYGANPVMTYIVAAMAPDKLAGWNFAPPEQARGIFPEAVFARPVIGGWFGQGKTPNIESLVALGPDVTLVSGVTAGTDRSLPLLSRLGLAGCEIPLERLEYYPDGLRKAGTAMGVPERGEALARMAERLLAEREAAARLETGPAPDVYYAQGPDGLATECDGSVHAEIIPLAGGRNVYVCPAEAMADRFGQVRIDFEHLARLDPDYIVTQEARLLLTFREDARWQSLRAVREGRVLLVPQVPFRWMDRPPSYMRLLAVHWLAAHIHPGSYPLDLRRTTAEFFELFFGRRLDDYEIDSILQPE